MITPAPIADEFEHLRKIEQKFELRLPSINSARENSTRIRQAITAVVDQATPENCGVVVCGSLGRSEMTCQSDVDWKLLVDGAVSAQHRDEVLRIDRTMGALSREFKFNSPNATGAFAGMCFSHELVHAIGGEADSNSNTTLRILLLLEARAISRPLVLDRVIRSILARYFEPDNFAYKQNTERDYFPRFLMNDVVRFWRTMAVDYAAKVVERGRAGWALRNAKLRFSRKLLFASGMLLAHEVVLGMKQPVPNLSTDPAAVFELIDRIQQLTKLSPLEMLAAAALRRADGWPGARRAATDIFSSYDAFLGILNDTDKRKELGNLPLEQAATNPTFNLVRNLGQQFEDGLNAYFLDGPTDVALLSRKYAIF